MNPTFSGQKREIYDSHAEAKTDELRDHFAGIALASVLQSGEDIDGNLLGVAARVSYDIADALLEERARRGKAR